MTPPFDILPDLVSFFSTLPQTADQKEPEFTPIRGLRAGWERHTYVIKTKHVELIEAAAYWSRKDIKTILEEALEHYFAQKKVKPLPVELRRERKPRRRESE